MYSSVRTITPPSVEPVSLDLARSHLRIDTEADNQLLEIYVGAARETVEKYLNRALITQTLQYAFADDARALYNSGWLQGASIWSFNGSWTASGGVQLPRAPAQSVASVVVNGAVTIDPTLYAVNLMVDPAFVTFLPGAFDIAGVPQSITITYVAGYGDKPAAVPSAIRNAILLTVAHLYEHRGDSVDEMPTTVRRLLDPDRLVSFGG